MKLEEETDVLDKPELSKTDQNIIIDNNDNNNFIKAEQVPTSIFDCKKCKVLGYTNVGLKMTNNEDSFLFDNCIQCGTNKKEIYYDYIPKIIGVFDGMGGANYGEYASRYGAEYVKNNIENLVKCNTREEVYDFFSCVNNFIVSKLDKLKDETRFSGTTTALVLFNKDQNRVRCINIGDSRIYFVYKNKIEQISYDDSYANYLYEQRKITKEEVKKVPFPSNIIMNALGNEHFQSNKTHLFDINLNYRKDLEYIFICSDGVSDLLPDQQIFKCFKSGFLHHKLNSICKKLETNVLNKGSKDNFSFVIWKVK